MSGASAQSGLSRESFERLLGFLGPDRSAAGRRYEEIRQKLIRFFSWEGCLRPEEVADEALNRLARRLVEGEAIQSLEGYLFGVARFVLFETLRRQRREVELGREPDSIAQDRADLEPEAERRSTCLDRCMRDLPVQTRSLILSYYSGEKGARIRNRKNLAQELGIQMNALRNRALRLRLGLEKCVRDCLRDQDKKAAEDTSI